MEEAKLQVKNPNPNADHSSSGSPPDPMLESMENPDDAKKEDHNHDSSVYSDTLIKKVMLEQGISCGPSKTDPDQDQCSGAADMEGALQVEVSNEPKDRKGKRVMEDEESTESCLKRMKKIDDDILEWVKNIDLHYNLNFENGYDLNCPPYEVNEDVFPLLNLKSPWSSPPLNWKLPWESAGAGPSNSEDKSEEFNIWPQLWINANNPLRSLPEMQNSETILDDDIEGNSHGGIGTEVIDVEKGIDLELGLCTSDEELDLSLKL